MSEPSHIRDTDVKRLPDNGPWKCGYFGLVWTGDISNHHGIDPPAFCPGPHTRDEMGLLLRRLHEGCAPTTERTVAAATHGMRSVTRWSSGVTPKPECRSC